MLLALLCSQDDVLLALLCSQDDVLQCVCAMIEDSVL